MSNGFGESFGSAYARSLQMTREEQEKQREKDRRQALLLQLVGAPLAQGIVKGVSTIIQEPFNESAVNFFNTEQGLQFRKDVANRDRLITAAKARDKNIQEGGLSYVEGEVDKRMKPGFDEFVLETYGKNPENFDAYHNDVSAYNRKRSELAKKDLAEHEELMSLVNSQDFTDKQVAAYMKKYSPTSSSPFQAFARFGKRFFQGLSKEEDEQQRLALLRQKLKLDDASFETFKKLSNPAKEFGITREQVLALPFLNDKESQEAYNLYKNSRKLYSRIRMDDSGRLGETYSSLQKQLGYLPSIPEFNRKIRQEVQSVFDGNLSEERTSFLARMQNEETRPQVVVEFLKESGKDLTRDQQNKEINRNAGAAFRIAKEWVDTEYASNGSLMDSLLDTEGQVAYKDLIQERASYLFTNHTKFVEEAVIEGSWWDSKIKDPRLVIEDIEGGYQQFKAAQPVEDADPTDPTNTQTKKGTLNIVAADSQLNAEIMAQAVQIGKYALTQPNPQDYFEEQISQLKARILSSSQGQNYTSVLLDINDPAYRSIIKQIDPAPTDLSALADSGGGRVDPDLMRERLRSQERDLLAPFRKAGQFFSQNFEEAREQRKQQEEKNRQLQQRRSLLARPGQIDDDDIVDQVSTNITAKPASDIEGIAAEVSKIFNDGRNATEMLKEIAIVESNMGQTPGTYDIAVDSKGNRGSLGVAQIDEIAFKEIQSRLKGGKGRNKYTQRTIDRVSDALGLDPTTIKYEDLADDKTNLVFARLYLMMRPDPIPRTPQDRAKYWKKYYNTVLGKGTPQKYLDRLTDYGLDI